MKARPDGRQNGLAAERKIPEAARFRALKEFSKAEQEVEELRRQEADARARFETAHRKTEAVSRVAENKRQEMIQMLGKPRRLGRGRIERGAKNSDFRTILKTPSFRTVRMSIKAAQNAERKQLDEIASVRHWKKE